MGELSDEVVDVILYGTKGEKLRLEYERANGKGVLNQPFEGIIPNVERRYRETQSDASRRELEELMSQVPCPDCQGQRLKAESLAVTVGGESIYRFTTKSVTKALEFMEGLALTPTQEIIAHQILKEIRSRLHFCSRWGSSTLPSAVRRAPCPAGRASASVWPPRSAPLSWGCCIFWTSRPSAFTSGTTTCC